MGHLAWQNDLNTGIAEIDSQHKRIVEMINQLYDAEQIGDREAVGQVIEDLVDYTMSHFAFEETLIEDAGYPLTRAHKKVHELFIRRVNDYKLRIHAGENVAHELREMLARWLFNHIRNEDAAYTEAVRNNLAELTRDKSEGGWLARSLKRFFR